MRNFSWIDEKYGIDAKDTSKWLPVNTNDFDDIKKDKFNQRKRAVDLYLNKDIPVKEILDRCGLSQSELNRILHRAFQSLENGDVAGYLACIPGTNLKNYTRTTKSGNGKAGRFKQFLEFFPEIKNLLDDLALGKIRINESKVRGPYYKRIWKVFRDLCKEQGIDIRNDYPFNTNDGGRDAVRNYCKEMTDKDFIRGAMVLHGDQSGALAAQASKKKLQYFPLQPYDLVQLDGHKIDGLLTVRLQDPQGEIQYLDIERIWLLVLLDVSSRAALGYSFCLGRNYTSESFLECIGNSYTPWSQMEIPIQGINYLPNAGLPSGVINGCAWRNFNSIQLDNHFVHLSEWVQNRVISSGALELGTNIPRHCRSNAIVERFFNTFEEGTTHQWPNTTGSNPKDVRLSSPDKEAKRVCVEYEDLKIIFDIAIANYNATPHSSLNARTPLEFIQYYIEEQGQLVRHLPKEQQNISSCSLFLKKYSKVIRGNPATGHLPYITFQKAKYSSPYLDKNPELIGQSVVFDVNIKDIRVATIYLPDGTNLGKVVVEDRWNVVPHSLRIRKAINSLVNKKILNNDLESPVENYMTYIVKRAMTSKKERNKMIQVSIETGLKPHKNKQNKSKVKALKQNQQDQNWISINKAFGE